MTIVILFCHAYYYVNLYVFVCLNSKKAEFRINNLWEVKTQTKTRMFGHQKRQMQLIFTNLDGLYLCSIAQRTTWLRLFKPNLNKILATCFSTVRLLITSSLAISLFDLPCATSMAISRSRNVRVSRDSKVFPSFTGWMGSFWA